MFYMHKIWKIDKAAFCSNAAVSEQPVVVRRWLRITLLRILLEKVVVFVWHFL